MRGKWEVCWECGGEGAVPEGSAVPCPNCRGLRVVHWAANAAAWEVIAARAEQEGNVVLPIREWTAEQWPELLKEANRHGLVLSVHAGEVGLTVVAHRKPAELRSAA
jgi:hypothetical protein